LTGSKIAKLRVLLIDNYDSFTYNIVHYVQKCGAEVVVVYNDAIPFNDVMSFDKVILSPGPGLPAQAGELMKFIKMYHHRIPILGICLGFQALIECFGGKLINQKEVKHGVAEDCFFNNQSTLFKNLPTNFKVGLYHSWCADSDLFPKKINVTAISEYKVIMAFEHQTLPLYGVQFHPESIITQNGIKIINNFLFS
jgi:anthranilate synthase component 2